MKRSAWFGCGAQQEYFVHGISLCGTTCSSGAARRCKISRNRGSLLHSGLEEWSKVAMPRRQGGNPSGRARIPLFPGARFHWKSNMLIRGNQARRVQGYFYKNLKLRAAAAAGERIRVNISTWFYFLLLTHHLNFYPPFSGRGIFMERAADDHVDLINNGIRA